MRFRDRAEHLVIALIAALASPATDCNGQPDPITPGSWTLAILPDTQVYAESFPQHFDAQTQWIVENAASHNIAYVLHEGDVTNRNTVAQWDNASRSLRNLDDRVPYAVSPGNHDYGPGGNAADRNSLFNSPDYFGPGSAYANQTTLGGFFEPGKTDNSFHTFQAGDQDWLVLALEFGPRDEVVTWANEVVAQHPDHLAMLVTHAYMYFDETIYDWSAKGPSQNWNPHAYGVASLAGESVNDGQELWDNLVSKHDNFRLTFNGHVLGDGTGYRSTLGDGGNVVHQMLANYQFKQQGGMGDMRLLEFKPDGETVIVKTYSPVLDRHDRAFDQEFTISLNELRAPLTPPPPTPLDTVLAGNLVVTGPTDPAANTVESVAFGAQTSPELGLLQVNRGDYQVAVDNAGLTYQQGVLLATVRQNERDGLKATVEVGRSSFGDGVLSLSVMETANPSDNELNFDTSVAWFQYGAGWQAAHVNGDGSLAVGASHRVEPGMVAREAEGRYHIDLGVDSVRDGLLFAIGGENGNAVVQTTPSSDANGWQVRVQDNATGFSPNGVDGDFAFVYLPYNTTHLVGGLYNGRADMAVQSVGDHTLTRTGRGVYELTIPGASADTGMLLLNIAGETTGDGATGPDDNVLTYQASEAGGFIIHSVDLPNATFQDTQFAWAYVSFDHPLTPRLAAGDFNRDGLVTLADYETWRSDYGTGSGKSDANGDGVVDAADYTVWRDALRARSSAEITHVGVPEPGGITMLFGCVVSAMRR